MTRSALPGLVLLAEFLLAGCGNEPVQVSASGFGAFEPALAVMDGRLAVAWNDNRHGSDDIFLRVLDEKSQPLTAALRLTNDPALSYEAALAVLHDNLAIAWYDREPGGRLVTRLGLWTADGTLLWQYTISSPDRNGRIPVLQGVGERLFIAWVEEGLPGIPEGTVTPMVRGAWIGADGTWLVPPFDISRASRTTWNLNADMLPDGRVLVVFDAAFVTRSSELYLALLADDQAIVIPLGKDDGFDSRYPDIAVGAEGIALTWFDTKDGNEEVYLALFDAPLTQDVLASAMRVTATAGESIGAYLCWNGPTLGLAWNDDVSGQHEIYFRVFATDGAPLTGARRLTQTAADSMIPAIVPWRDGFALAWNEVVLAEGGHDGAISQTRSEVVLMTVQ